MLKASMQSYANTNRAPQQTGNFTLEYLSSWLATTEKKGNSVWQASESDAALLHKAAHMVIKPEEQAFEIQNKRMTKCSPCPFLSLSCSLLLPPLTLQHFTQKKRDKYGDNVVWWNNGTKILQHKRKSIREGNTYHSAQLSTTQKHCKSFIFGCCQQGSSVRPTVKHWGVLTPTLSHSWCFLCP